jgi:hypothetical protein
MDIGSVNTFLRQRILLETGCLLCGPCRDVITRTVGAMNPETRVEAESNISTVALGVVGGDEKGLQFLRV